MSSLVILLRIWPLGLPKGCANHSGETPEVKGRRRSARFAQFTPVPAVSRVHFTVIPGWSEGPDQMCNCTLGNLEIPGSLVSLRPRNDAQEPFPSLLRLHPLEFGQLVPKPGELALGILARIGAADRRRLSQRDFPPEMLDQRGYAMGLHGRQ